MSTPPNVSNICLGVYRTSLGKLKVVVTLLALFGRSYAPHYYAPRPRYYGPRGYYGGGGLNHGLGHSLLHGAAWYAGWHLAGLIGIPLLIILLVGFFLVSRMRRSRANYPPSSPWRRRGW